MNVKDRLQFLDQCVAGEKTRFDKLLSIKIFDEFDWSYRIYRDYIKQKNKITNIACDVTEDLLTIHIESKVPMEDLLSDSFPKKGITPVETESGVDLNINLMDSIV